MEREETVRFVPLKDDDFSISRESEIVNEKLMLNCVKAREKLLCCC
jgi:hypothetical protein